MESGYSPAGFSLRQTFSTIWRFRRFVLAVVVVSVGIGYYQSAMARVRYRAGSVVYVQPDQASPLAGLGGGVARMLGGAAGGGLRSQVELLRSMAVLADVVDRTGLRLMELEEGLIWDDFHPTVLVQAPSVVGDPPFDRLQLTFEPGQVVVRAGSLERQAPYGTRVEIQGVGFTVASRPEVETAELYVLPRFAAAGHLARYLDVRIRTDTNVLDVMYAAYDPIVAQRVVNATVESFQNFDGRRKSEEAELRGRFLSEQIVYTDSLLVEAQQALIAFQQRVEGRSSRERFGAQQSGLIDLEFRRTEMDSERRMYSEILAGLNEPRDPAEGSRIRAAVASPSVGENPMILALVERLLAYEGTRDGLTAGVWGSALTNPEVARLDTLIRATEERLAEALTNYVGSLDARIEAVDQLRTRTVAGMENLPAADAEELRIEHQIDAITDILGYLQQGYHMARVEEAVGSGSVEIIDLARPGDPFGVDPIRTMAFALIFGLMLGSGGAIVLGSLGSSIRQRDEVEQLLQLPQLAVIPSYSNGSGRYRLLGRSQNGTNGASSPVPTTPQRALLAADGQSASAEAFRALRTNLIFGRGSNALRTIAVTSAAPGEGRSSTVANLGVTLAHQGLRVLLIDCDLRRPELHNLFGAPREPGLAELVLGEVEVDDVVGLVETDGVHLVAAGGFSPRALHLLGTSRFQDALERLSVGFDVVLLDTPPLRVTVDGAVIAAHADGAIFLVRAGKTDRREAQAALQQLAAVGANIVGGVLNDTDEKPAFSAAYRDS